MFILSKLVAVPTKIYLFSFTSFPERIISPFKKMGSSCSHAGKAYKPCEQVEKLFKPDACCRLIPCTADQSCPSDFPLVCMLPYGDRSDVAHSVCKDTGGKCKCIEHNFGRRSLSPVDADTIEEYVNSAPDFEKYDDKKSS